VSNGAFWDLQASVGATGATLLWRGVWSEVLSYNPYDAASYEGSSYISLTNNENKVPSISPNDWALLAAEGSTGQTAFVSLTDGATITWTMSTGKVNQNAMVTLGGNRTLVFSGHTNGMSGTLIVKQDAIGNRMLILPSGSKVLNSGAGVITLSVVANAIDILTWVYDGTNIFWTFGKNYT
jgi:hypothetical protein